MRLSRILIFALFIGFALIATSYGPYRPYILDPGHELAPPYPVEPDTPRTIYRPDLASRELDEFPRRASAHAIARELRAHLEGVAIAQPNSTVLATLYFVRPIDSREFHDLTTRYALTGGKGTEIAALDRIVNPANFTPVATSSASTVRMVTSLTARGTTSELRDIWRRNSLTEKIVVHGTY